MGYGGTLKEFRFGGLEGITWNSTWGYELRTWYKREGICGAESC